MNIKIHGILPYLLQAILLTGLLAGFPPCVGAQGLVIGSGAQVVVQGSPSIVIVNGKWQNDGVFLPDSGSVKFEGTALTINSTIGGLSDPGEFYDLALNKSVNGVALTAETVVSNTLILTAGVLDLNSHTLVIGRSDTTAIVRAAGHILSEQPDNSGVVAWVIDDAPGNHEFPFGAVSGTYIPLGIQVTAGAIDTARVSTFPTNNANQPFPSTPTFVSNVNNDEGQDNSANTVDRFWEINTSLPGGVVILHFTAQVSELDAATDLIAQRWDSLSNTWDAPLLNQSRSGNAVTVPEVSEFTTWTLGTETAPLAVEFLTFEAYALGEIVLVKWTTANETNSDYFTVQRSRDKTNFETTDIVQAAGNSFVLLHYAVNDLSPFEGRSFYRIMETDNEGRSITTEIKEVYFDANGNVSITATPNPTTNDNIGVTIVGLEGQNVEICLADAYGRNVRCERVFITGHSFRHVFQELQALSPGIYSLSIDSQARPASIKVIVW